MAEETLFTDIINTLGKAKKEGKISGGYRYKDGKLNIGGGYYGDDSMLEIDVNKDGGNILFKKRFKDGGSTNGSGDKAFTAKVKELMDDGYELGEAVKEAMKQGYKDGGITTPKRGLVDGPGSYSGESAYANIKKLGIESQIKQMFADGLGAGNITKRLKLLYPNKIINSTLIGDYLTYAQRNLGLVKPAIAIRNQFGPIRSYKEIAKIVDNAPNIKKGPEEVRMNIKDLTADSKKNNRKKGGTQYISKKESEKYKKQLKAENKLGPSTVVENPNAKSDANKKRAELDKKSNASAGAATVSENKKISTKFVTKANNDLRQDLKKNSTETINKIRNNKKIMFELENSFDSKSGEFKTEKVSNKKIKTLIKGGMFSMEHTSPMVAGAKNTNFTTNLSLITNRANSKIMRPLDTFLNSKSYKDFSDPRVVKVKDFLSKNNLRIKIKNDGKPIYFGDETKFKSAAERINKQSKGYRLNSGLAAVEEGAGRIFSNVKDSVKNLGKVDFNNMQLGTGNVAKAAGVAKNVAKVAGRGLGYAAIPLMAYDINNMRKEGKTAAEMLAYPLFLDGRVAEAQDLLKMSSIERQSIMDEQIANDESFLDTDFSQPYREGVNSVDNKMVRKRVALEREAEEKARKAKRTKKSSGFTLPFNYGISSFDGVN
jgi:hypothetical protein